MGKLTLVTAEGTEFLTTTHEIEDSLLLQRLRLRAPKGSRRILVPEVSDLEIARLLKYLRGGNQEPSEVWQLPNHVIARLGNEVTPVHYELELTLDPETSNFQGRVAIHLDLQREVSTLELHAGRDLDLWNITLEGVEIANMIRVPGHELLLLRFTQPLVTRSTILHFEYSAPVSTQELFGLYYSEYQGTKVLTTQFQPIYARRCFPCWDEPSFRSTFQVTVTTPKGYMVLSNTKQLRFEVVPDGVRRTFAVTPPMSSYLVAVVVGKFRCIESRTTNGVQVRCWHVGDRKDQAAFAVTFAAHCLDYYQEWFDYPYPLDKCDLVAIPAFAAGAMENWGCITFREEALLCTGDCKLAAIVIAHELAHQWTGNLVTLAWWDELFLNESLTSFMKNLACQELYPEWDELVDEDWHSALVLDSTPSSHPMKAVLTTADNIISIFDSITYIKGAGVFRSYYRYLGPSVFQAGLRRYIKRYAYQNTTISDLCASWSRGELLRQWLVQAGYPVISVAKEPEGISLQQSDIIPDRKQVWIFSVKVHMHLHNGMVSEHTIYLDSQTRYLPVDWTSVSWLQVNPDQSIYCRVAYDPALQPLFQRANESAAGVFLDDYYELVRVRASPWSELFAIWCLFIGCQEALVCSQIRKFRRSFPQVADTHLLSLLATRGKPPSLISPEGDRGAYAYWLPYQHDLILKNRILPYSIPNKQALESFQRCSDELLEELKMRARREVSMEVRDLIANIELNRNWAAQQ